MGGDEFVIMFPETDQESAKIIVGQLEQYLSEEVRKNGWSVTFSIGVLTCIKIPETFDLAIRAADSLMYEVKRHGKNSTIYSTYTG